MYIMKIIVMINNAEVPSLIIVNPCVNFSRSSRCGSRLHKEGNGVSFTHADEVKSQFKLDEPNARLEAVNDNRLN